MIEPPNPTPKTCEVTTEYGVKTYKYNGNSVSLANYIGYGCCDDVTADDVKYNATAKNLYENKCSKPETKACEVTTNGGKKVYKYYGNIVPLANYISYGCCDGITDNDVKYDEPASYLYNSLCKKPETKACEVVNLNGFKMYKYNGQSVSLTKYIENGCCNDITAEDVKKNIEASELYYSKCDKTDTPSLKCEIVGNASSRSYKNYGKDVSITDFIKAGCCENITSADLAKDSNAESTYNRVCLADDLISLNNKCGSKAKLGLKEYIIDNGSNTESLLKCEKNESYVDYTHSEVTQMSIGEVLKRVENLELNSSNIEGIYNNSGIINYEDRNYLSGIISSDNNYCMMFTSESNKVHFPGTAISTSGRFFVFNELDNEECRNSLYPGANCFRQPYIEGSIDAVLHTNFKQWDKDYTTAIDNEKKAYEDWKQEIIEGPKREYQAIYNFNNCMAAEKSNPLLITTCQNLYNVYLDVLEENKRRLEDCENFYKSAVAKRIQLEGYKKECEVKVKLKDYWVYNLNPSLEFTYIQKAYDSKGKASNRIEETVKMDISTEAVRYWPKVSDLQPNCEYSDDSESKTKYTISYGSINETTEFYNTENYSAKCYQTLYYKPRQVTYATIPSGRIVDSLSYQATGYEVGYVYNVNLTTYEGTYTTYFKMNNIGHISGEKSNLQKILDNHRDSYDESDFSSECVYCNQEGAFKRICDVCDPEDPQLGANYIYRSISLGNVTPQDRENTNWSDNKGRDAETLIQAASGNEVISALSLNKNSKEEIKDNKVSTLNTELVADNIYNDQSKEYLEYEITLTTRDMNIIRENTARREFTYNEVNLCSNSNLMPRKSADADYCYICNRDGKECRSTFIDAFADDIDFINNETRKEKWKYYINNKWEKGNWSRIAGNYTALAGFESGRYPDPDNQEYFLKLYNNWP